MQDLFSALCLVAIIEGLFLFIAPLAWKRMAAPVAALLVKRVKERWVLIAVGVLVLSISLFQIGMAVVKLRGA